MIDVFLMVFLWMIGEVFVFVICCDEWFSDCVWFEIEEDVFLWYVLELRLVIFVVEDSLWMLWDYGVVLVVVDMVGWWLCFDCFIMDFVYVCLYGVKMFYYSVYILEELWEWVELIWFWWDGIGVVDGRFCDVYVYFDNDVRGYVFYDVWVLVVFVDEGV